MRFSIRLAINAFAAIIFQGSMACAPPSHPPSDPNILLILTDDQRWDTVQYMDVVKAELAHKGVTFANSFVSVPSCCPSRASTYSGLWGHNTGVAFNRDSGVAADAPGIDVPNGGIVAFDNSTSIALALQGDGYRTALIGKVMNQNDDFSPRQLAGWDYWVTFIQDAFNLYGAGARHPYNPSSSGYSWNVNGTVQTAKALRAATPTHAPPGGGSDLDYSTDVVRDLAVEWLGTVTVPFFLVVAPYAPHFDDGVYTTHPAVRHKDWGVNNRVTFTLPPSFNEADISDKPEWLQNAQASVWDSPAGIAANVDAFRYETVDALQAIDELVMALLIKLDQMGVGNDTMIVFTSDNGYAWGEHRLGQKLHPYEESIRVPLIIRYPRAHSIEFPTTETRLVSNVDLAPTFAEMAGIGGTFNGASLLPILDGTATTWRSGLLVEGWMAESTIPNKLIPAIFPVMPDYAVIRREDWKLVDYATGTDELYDMINDPFELRNEIANPAHATVLATLRSELAALRAE